MPAGIMILGSPGAGKTTLGRRTAEVLGLAFIDIDDCIWRQDTERPFTVLYSRAERISRVRDAVERAGRFVMAGSMDSFHAHFDPYFVLAVHLHADAQLRVARVHARECERFGQRVLAGGDMFEEHEQFLADVAGYDEGRGRMTLERHEAWLASLSCPVFRLDGADPLEHNVQILVQAYREIQSPGA